MISPFINKNICADNYYLLQQMPDDSIDLICTDPNYGYSFMNLEWDKRVPNVETLRECLRVLKPGCFGFFMASPRQDVLCEMLLNLRYAGFNTAFSSIYWTYATGFPKAADMSLLIDKKLGKERTDKIGNSKYEGRRPNSFGKDENGTYGNYNAQPEIPVYAPASQEAKRMQGSYAGFQPKPAVEIIIVVMKPLSEKSFVNQAIKTGKGVTWLDDCIIPYSNTDDKEAARFGTQADIKGGNFINHNGHKTLNQNVLSSEKGRFPANLLVSDDVLNDGKEHVCGSMNNIKGGGYGGSDVCYGENSHDTFYNYQGNAGSYSRYFDLDEWFHQCAKHIGEEQLNTFPFLVVAKPSPTEKNDGLINIKYKKVTDRNNDSVNPLANRLHNKAKKKNFHPTVKPIILMSYLITLASRENDIVLDPWVGSGTTCIASKMLTRKYIGIDKNPDFIELADLRVKATKVQLKMF